MYFSVTGSRAHLVMLTPEKFCSLRYDTMTNVLDHNKWVLKRDPLQHVQDYEGLLLSRTHMLHVWFIDLHVP